MRNFLSAKTEAFVVYLSRYCAKQKLRNFSYNMCIIFMKKYWKIYRELIIYIRKTNGQKFLVDI